MDVSVLRSPSVTRALILALGSAVLVQVTPGFVLGAPTWITSVVILFMSVVVLTPIALTFLAPKLVTRSRVDDLDETRIAWWRIVPLLFVPWILATCLQIPWHGLSSSSISSESLESIDSFRLGAYSMGLLVGAFAVIYVCHRSRLLTRHGALAVLSLAIFALTSIGSWFVMMVGRLALP